MYRDPSSGRTPCGDPLASGHATIGGVENGAEMKILIGVVASAMALGFAPVAHSAGSSSVSTGDASASISASDVQFDGSECVSVPWSVTWSFAPSASEYTDGSVQLEIRQPGSSYSNSSSAFFYASESRSGTKGETFYICPFEYSPQAGAFSVTGTFKSDNYETGAEQTAPIPAISVNAIQNPTSLGPVKIVKTGFGYTVSGTATAATITKGVVGAGGEVRIEVRKPKSKRWTGGVMAYPDGFGNWTSSIGRLPKGSDLRVTLTNCRWCTDASRTAKIRR